MTYTPLFPAQTPAKARALADALNAYAAREDAGYRSDHHLFAACKAAEAFTDDGDFCRLRRDLCDENGWDDDGFPDPDLGEPYRIGGFAHWEARP